MMHAQELHVHMWERRVQAVGRRKWVSQAYRKNKKSQRGGGREKDGEGKWERHSAEREHRKVITQIQLTSDCCSIAVKLYS